MNEYSLKRNRPVAVWLWIGAGMIVVQVLLGGITRLTGSGLSITEWQPILGAFPPMNEAAWNEAFDKYKEIGQYKHLNTHFSLSDFKAIYFWEWLHRDWARLMGLVFLFPFIYFVVKKKIDKTMIRPMVILFLLGALQGLIGWIMVKSGINTESTYVSHIRLAIHFIAALALLCYVVWFALKISVPKQRITQSPFLKLLNIALLVLVSIQLVYGAFMAGAHAALAGLTWPTINGVWVPESLLTEGGFWSDISHNLLTIQFIHRNLAYLLTLILLIWWVKASKLPATSVLRRMRHFPMVMIIVQVILGVLALLNSLDGPLLLFGILHQFGGMVLLLMLTVTLFYTSYSGNTPSRAGA
ncbi:MAG TPA: COX15/CtaA family protein [Sphingobacteriaceae bacterium]